MSAGLADANRPSAGHTQHDSTRIDVFPNQPLTNAMNKDQYTVELAQEFHRNMTAIIDAVQVGIWQKGVLDLLNYSTDYGFGQKRGLQTLILKTGHKTAYVRLHWDTIFGSNAEDQQLVASAVQNAILELG